MRIAVLLGCSVLLGACSSVPDTSESGFDFERDAFAFPNFGTETPGSQLTLSLATRMFGRDAVCEDPTDPCVARPEAEAWVAQMNQALAFGHSEGFAVLSLLMMQGKVSAADFGAPRGGALDGNNQALRDELTYWAVSQGITAVHAKDKRFSAKDVMPFLAEALKPGQAERWRLLVAMSDGQKLIGGHALVPFGYFKGGRDGLYYLRIYDSNMPEAEQRLEIDVTANTWRYEGAIDATLPRTYSGTAQNGNLLWFSPVGERLGQLPAPFAAGAPLRFSASYASMLVEGGGVSVGFKDGQLVEQGGTVEPTAANAGCSLPNEILTVSMGASDGGAQTVQVKGSPLASNPSTVNATGAGVSVQVTGAAVASSSDQLTVDPKSKTVTYASGGDSAITITTTTKQPDGSTTTVSVTVAGTSKSIVVDASDPNNVKVGVDDAPPGTTIGVTVTNTDTDGKKSSVTTQGTTKEDKDIQIDVQPKTGTSNVNTNINLDICLNDKKDPGEADVDCGALCVAEPWGKKRGNGYCANTRSCSGDDDCTSSNCLQGVCANPTCTDGKKNGRESDLDCGEDCQRCASGKLCRAGSDCEFGSRCLQNTCVGPGSHSLFVRGLPTDLGARTTSLIDGNFREQVLYGTTVDFVHVFTSVEKFWWAPRSRFQGDADCRLERFDEDGKWEWSRTGDAGVGSQQNTLTCRRSLADIVASTGTGGCASVVSGKFLGGSPPIATVSQNGVDVGSAYLYSSGSGTFSLAQIRYRDAGVTAFDVSVTGPQDRALTINGETNTYRHACTVADAGTREFPAASGTATVSFDCSCLWLNAPADAGFDAGFDAGLDAGVDAGLDAGLDAGIDAGVSCTFDNQCASLDCYCGVNSNNCTGNTGACGAGKAVFSAPTTNGVAPTGTFTVPSGCTSLRVSAWGAAGGDGNFVSFPMPPLPSTGGAGGFVSGQLTVSPGDVFTAWVGSGGAPVSEATTATRVGSYLGTPANGGLGDGMPANHESGGGGGLTSARLTGSATVSFSVPAGSGASPGMFGMAAGDTGSGDAMTRSGQSAGANTESGGGGAGDPGGTAGAFNGEAGVAGAFGALPSGLTGSVGSGGNPASESIPDHSLCPAEAGIANGGGGVGGNGCLVVRCVAP